MENNRIDNCNIGVMLERGLAPGCAVRGNRILRNAPQDNAGTMPIERDALRSVVDNMSYAIDVRSEGVRIEGNFITQPAALWESWKIVGPARRAGLVEA